MKEPMLPPMAESLDMDGVKRLCMAMLCQTLNDASLQSGEVKHHQAIYGKKYAHMYKDNALWFAKSELAITICEVYGIDYPSFLKKVEENYKGGKRGKYNQTHC